MEGHEEHEGNWPSAKQKGKRDERAVQLLQPTLENTNTKIRRQPLHVTINQNVVFRCHFLSADYIMLSF